MRQNLQVTEQGRLCRRTGWRKFLSFYSDYNNQDLHDQLCKDRVVNGVTLSTNYQTYFDELNPPNDQAGSVTDYSPSTIGEFCALPQKKRDSLLDTERQPITMLFQSSASTGQRKLLAGCQSRLYALNEERGNWKLIGDGFGGTPKLNCTAPRFYCAQVGDTVLFTNNYDLPFSWTFDQPTFGCAQRAVAPISDLNLIDLSRAACIYSWKGILFLGDVEMENTRFGDRIVWSDVNAPLSFDPGKIGTQSSFQDLGYGEKILAFSELGDYLVIYTTNGIWLCTLTLDATGNLDFNFRNIYAGGAKREACLVYRNTLVAVGDVHYFAGVDAIYAWSTAYPKPERVEWIHRAAGIMFNDLNKAACDAHCAGYNPDTKELWVSWVQQHPLQSARALCPSKTLSYNLRYQMADVIDHGFSAFGNYVSDTRGTIADFLLRYCGCYPNQELIDDLAAIGQPESVKEGPACSVTNGNCASTNRNMPIYTTIGLPVPGTDLVVEDYTQPESSDPSFCRELDGVTFDDLCQSCDSNQVFVMASANDLCLKQADQVYYRERFIDIGTSRSEIADSAIVCDSVYINYAFDGYNSLQRSSAMPFSDGRGGTLSNVDKNCRRITMAYLAEPQANPVSLSVRIGISAQPVDPNDDACVIQWRTLQPELLACLASEPNTELESQNLRPNYVANFPCFSTGRFVYTEFSFGGTGASACFSSQTLEIRTINAS